MRIWHLIIARLRSLVFRQRSEKELDEELRLHIDREISRRIAAGAPPEEARLSSLREFGAIEQLKAECREARGVSLVENIAQDVRFACRRLRYDWQFTLAAVLMLALGIGANSAIFSIVNTALFRPQPFRDVDRLVDIYENSGNENNPVSDSFPAYLAMTRYTDVFSGVAAVCLDGVSYRAGDRPRTGIAEYVTSNYLSVLGLMPALGRWFDEREDATGANAAAVVGYRTWKTRFAADPGVIGQTIRLNGAPVTIVGVGPEELNNSMSAGLVTDFWLSISSISAVALNYPADILERRQGEGFFQVKARLREGVGTPQAQAAMDGLANHLQSEFPSLDPAHGITVLGSVRIHPQVDRLLLPAASLLLAVVGLVLAIACSNLATLILVRGSSRSKEVSVRLALGANRAQLVRHLLTESLILSIGGGMAGYILAVWVLRLVTVSGLPLLLDLTLDYRVLAFTFFLSLSAGVAFGLVPALKATTIDVASTLRGPSDTLSLSRSWFTLKNMLVVFQVAASCVLLVGAGLFLRSLLNARGQDVGIAVKGVAILQTAARTALYPPKRESALYADLLSRVKAIPGVQAVALTNGPPVGGFQGSRSLVIDGDAAASGRMVAQVPWLFAGPGYFDTLQIPILYGRAFDDGDRPDTPPVAVINETMARRYFGTVNAVGRRFRDQAGADAWEVIGVVRNTNAFGGTNGGLFYRSVSQTGSATPTVLARSGLDAAGLIAAMQLELAQLDRELPVVLAKTLEQHIEDSLILPKATASFLSLLGLVGLALATVGLYAMVAFAVSRRSLEVGIRMALGARASLVIWLIVRDVAALVAAGIVLGLGMSWLAAPALGALLYNMSAADPFTFVSVALLMATVALAAAYFPARRAVRADPLVALRRP